MRAQVVTAYISLLALSAGGAIAQPVAIGIGYDRPSRVLAPGQVVTVFVEGLDLPEGTDVHAEDLPLPVKLAGISATLVQRVRDGEPFEHAVPLFRVVTYPDCSRADLVQPCVRRAAITLQVPFEASAIGPRAFPLFSDLVSSQDGVRGPAVSVRMTASSVHFLDRCDASNPAYDPESAMSCGSILTAVDGSPIGNAFRPARPGEIIVAWAFGLGFTEPPVPSGEASPNPPAVAINLGSGVYRFEFPSVGTVATVEVIPAFVGLAPGFVGLYQINIPAPRTPDGVPPCGSGIHSNARMTVVGGPNFVGDSIELCIDPG